MILGVWSALGLLLIGVGALVRRACHSPAHDARGLLLSFWIGWACLLFALQLWHLFLPVDGRLLPVLVGAGLPGLVLGGPGPWWTTLRAVRRRWPLCVALLAAALWMSNLALGGPRHGDSGAYFIPNVRWA